MTRVFRIILTILLAFVYHTLIAQICNVPSGIVTMVSSSDNAQISWAVSAPPLGATFQIEIIKAGENFSGIPDSTDIASLTLLLQDLDAASDYRFKIRMKCGTNDFSAWSAASSFRTYLSNPSPCGMNLAVGDLSCDTATNHFPVEVTNAPGSMLGQDVSLRSVRVILEHDWLIDLALYLRAPDGTRIKLVDSIGSGSDNFGNVSSANCGEYTEFSSYCTTTPISDPQNAIPPYIGTFFPKQNLNNFDTGGSPNGTWVLEICDDKANNVGTLQYFELVFSSPNCAPPEQINIVDVFADGITLDWDTIGVQADSVFLEIGKNGFRPANGRALFGDTLIALPYPLTFPISISGLETFTDLTAYIRYKCSGIDGANSCAIPFFTSCDNPDIEENFNNQSICSSSCGQACDIQSHWGNIEDGDDIDWIVRTGSTPSGGTGPTGDYEGTGNYIYVEASCLSNLQEQKTAELRSQCIDINAQANACNLTFAYHMLGSKIGSLRLEISTDGGLTWQMLFEKNGAQGAEWQQQNIDLSFYNGLTAVFRFIGTIGGGTAGDIAIDNIRFFGSSIAGQPSIYFADVDGDGFGDALNPKGFCLTSPPSGYVTDDTDCDDSNPSIYPGAVEILCNDVDENCNGMADDRFIEAPVVEADSTCVGGAITLNASNAKGQFYWYDAVGQLLSLGNELIFNDLNANQSVFVFDSLSATSGTCASEIVEVALVAMSIPSLSLSTTSGKTCIGVPFDLSLISAYDSVQSAMTLTWTDAAFIPLSNTEITSNQAGIETYYLIGNSDFRCADTVSFLQTIQANPSAHILQGDSIATCIGSTVVLNGIASGGQAPYTYAWNNGLNFANIPVNAASVGGTTQLLEITVTDANNCKATDSLSLHTLESITDTKIEAVTDVTSCGGIDGSILLRPLDGQGPYDFSWNGPTSGSLTNIQNAGLIDGLTQGAYRVTITDNSSSAGCGMIMPLIIISAPGLTANIDTVIDASCFGVADGTIMLNVDGIVPTYQWNNGDTTQNLNQVTAESYSVTVTDGACVLSLDSIKIEEPTEISIDVNELRSVACNSDSTGYVELFTQGGTAPYNLLWSNSEVGDSVSNLPAGIYDVIITDAIGCTNSAAFVIPEPSSVEIMTLQATDSVNCYGDATGLINTEPTGGVGAYTFAWSNTANTASISSLAAGVYDLIVTDGNGCTASFQHEIKSPDSLYISSIDIVNPSCKGVADGTLNLSLTGGSVPYDYLWNNADTTAMLSGLEEGSYLTTIFDANGCFITSPAYILEANQVLNPNIESVIDVACHGEETGKIVLSTEGGTAPYHYTWNGQQGQDSLIDISKGAYVVQIVDAEGCTIKMDSIYVGEPLAPLSAAFSSVEMPICFGQATGSLGADVEGGTAPYIYFWNGNNQGPDVGALVEGNYELIVVDDNQCADTLTVFLENPEPISVQADQVDTIPCFGNAFGTLCLNAVGGTGALNAQWSNGLQGDCQTTLLPGTYETTVTDAVGCESYFGTYSVVSEDALFEIESLEVTNNPCAGDTLASISVCLPETEAPYQFSWNAPIGLHTQMVSCDTLSDLSPGRYRLKVTDARGCTAEMDTLIEEPSLLRVSIPTSMAFEPICFGDSTGSLTALGNGGKPPYNYQWNNGMFDESIYDLPQGCYRCTITDMNACTATTPDFYCLSTPAELEVNLSPTGITHDDCSNGKGAISIVPSGGVPGSNPDYFYDWSNGFDSRNPSNLNAGTYFLTLSDHVGCSVEVGPFVVLPDPSPLITADSTVKIQNVACLNDSSGRIEIIPSGGRPNYLMSWSEPNLSGFVVENLPAGLYQATITDGDLCTATYSIVVSQPSEALEATASFSHANTGQQNGTASVDIMGGSGDYSVQWDAATNFQTGETAFNLPAGYYCATISDSLGCMIETCVDVLTNTDLPEAITRLQLAPNPAFSTSTLFINLAKPAALQYTILNVQGRIFSQKNSDKAAEHVLQINASVLPSGLYFVKMILEDGITLVKPFAVDKN